MDITAFREQYPQYNSLSDTDLADALHQKYYSDVPKDQFYASFGVSPQPQQPQGPVQAPPPTGIFDTVGNAIGGAWNRAQSTFDNAVAETYRQAAVDQGKSFRDLAREKVADTGLTDLNGKPLDNISSIGPIDALSAALRYAFQSKDSTQAAQDYNKAVEWKKAAQDQANEGELKYPMTARGSERAKSLEDRTKDMSFSQDPVGSTYEVGKWFFEDPAGAALSFGEQAARSAAPIAVGAATTAVTKNPALGAMALGGSSYAMERFSSVDDFLKERGYDLNKPEDVQRALSDDKVMKEANDYGITRGVIIGAFDLLGGKLSGVKMSGKPIVNAGGQLLAQAATDGGGEAAAQLATKGKVNIADVVQEIGGGMVTSIPEAVAVGGQKTRDVVPGLGITNDAIDKMVGDKNTADNADAAARVAARITQYEAQGFDPTDIEPTSDKGAKQILTGINMDLGNEIKQLYEKVKPLVSPRDDSVLTDIFDRAALATAVRKGVNRLKSGMTDADIAKVESLVGHTQEGFALVEKLKEAREVGRLYQRGVQGGISRLTDKFAPIPKDVSTTSVLSLLGAIGTHGASTAAQTAIWGAGRAIDSVTGNRSRVARYVRDYGNRNVLTPTITPPSGLRSLTGEQEALRLQKEAAQAARERAVAAAAMARVAEAERKKNVRETGLRLMRETIAKDEVPGGGFLRSIYDTHGLKPRQIVLGLNRLRTSGEIDASIADAFLLDPNSLMSGNVGNQIVDRLVRLADAGTISRDANWKPQAAQGPTVGMPGQTAQGPTMTSATRQPPMDERRRIAYEQQARANQERVSQTIISIQADPRIPDAIKPRLLEAVALIGKTNNKQEAQKIADGIDTALSFDPALKVIAQSYIQPLVDQIRHAIDPNGPKPQAMRRSEAKITKARTEALVQGVINAANAVDKLNNPRPDAPQVSTKKEASFDPEAGRQRALQGYDNEPSDVRLTAPTIKLADLVGEKIMLIPADLTKGGEWFAGIDQSRLDDPIKTKGGPSFPLLKTYADGSWAWANKGKGKGTQKVRKAQDNGVRYAIITAMSPDAHQSNDTVSKAVFGTLEAYVRDGRISTENLNKLAENIQGLTYKTQVKDASGNKVNKTVDFKDFPGFGDRQKLHDYLEALPFQSRAELIKELRKARSEQLIGGPLASRVINAMRDPEYEGYNWGDGSLVIELPQSAEGASKRFDAEGTETHESYAYGMKGRVVGKLATPVNYKALFPDWISRFEKLPESQKQKVTGDNYPIQQITPELVQNLDGNVALQDIKSSRHADMLLDAIIGNWRDSATAKNADGLDVAEFTHQLKVSKYSTMLTQYPDKKAFTDDVNNGLKVWQLGNSRVYVGIKPVNYAQEYGAKDKYFNEPHKAMVSVVNNEAGSKGMGAAAVLKAIEEGAEVLDCVVLRTPEYPNGYLPTFYKAMGFEVVEEVPFDPKYMTDEVKHQWRNLGWTEGPQMPTIALMRWRGTDENRSEATRAFISNAGRSLPRGSEGALTTGTISSGPNRVADSSGRREPGQRDARDDQGGRGDLRRNVERGFHSAALEAAGLSPGLIRSLNLDPKKILQAQQALASRGLSFGPK